MDKVDIITEESAHFLRMENVSLNLNIRRN